MDLGGAACWCNKKPQEMPRVFGRKKGASWSLNWPYEANVLAHMQFEFIISVPL